MTARKVGFDRTVHPGTWHVWGREVEGQQVCTLGCGATLYRPAVVAR